MAFPDWRTTPRVSPGELMVDRVVLTCRGAFAFASRANRADVMAALTRGRTPFEGRLPQGYRWVGDGDGRLRLRTLSTRHAWLITVQLELYEPTAADPDQITLRATVGINPTRVRALLPDADAARVAITRVAPAVAQANDANPINNELSTAQLLHPGAEYGWIDDAALMVDGAMALVASALFSDRPTGQPPIGRGEFTNYSITQIEVYSDFRGDDPIAQLQHFHGGVQGGSRTEWNSVRIGDEDGYRTVTVPLLRADTTKAVFYSRGDGRIRAEVRYLKNASRSVRGSTLGDTRQRLRGFADDAARRLNRILASSWPSRRRHLLLGMSSFGEMAALVASVVTTYKRSRDAIDHLCRFRHIRAGGRLGMITPQEAGRLRRLEVLTRAPNRSRDPGGTVYSLHWRFPPLPGGIEPEAIAQSPVG